MIVNKKILKGVMWVLIGAFVFANSLFLNVLVHEFGHYLAAEQYRLEPKMELNLEKMGNLSFGLESVPLASTSFIDNGNKEELAVIVLMGPFMNLLMGIAFLVFFVFLSGRKIVEEIGLIGMSVSFGSFLMNMLPIAGVDGSLIFGVI